MIDWGDKNKHGMKVSKEIESTEQSGVSRRSKPKLKLRLLTAGSGKVNQMKT